MLDMTTVWSTCKCWIFGKTPPQENKNDRRGAQEGVYQINTSYSTDRTSRYMHRLEDGAWKRK